MTKSVMSGWICPLCKDHFSTYGWYKFCDRCGNKVVKAEVFIK